MFEVFNPATGAVVFEGFPTVDKALRRIRLCKLHEIEITLKVRRTGTPGYR